MTEEKFHDATDGAGNAQKAILTLAHPRQSMPCERTQSDSNADCDEAETTIGSNQPNEPASHLDAADTSTAVQPIDVEHVPVKDDPRLWSNKKKNYVLLSISSASFIASLTAAIYFPATTQIQNEFHATNSEIALTASLFILFQGLLPTFWAAASETTGRKPCYYVASVIYTGASIGCALAPSIGALIGLRVLESAGASAVLSIGAGSLADIYDTHQRGRKVGLFYSSPLFAQAIAPILGGALTSASSWRSTFWFCVAYGALIFITFIPMPEPFRKERSLAWRRAAKRAEVAALQKVADAQERKNHEAEDAAREGESTPKAQKQESAADMSSKIANEAHLSAYPTPPASPKLTSQDATGDLPPLRAGESKPVSLRDDRIVLDDGTTIEVKVTLRDVNPLAALGAVIRKPNNVLLSTYTGLFFGLSYCLLYTGGFTYAEPPYSHSAIIVGAVLLAFGAGNVIGSILGGKYSDHVFLRLRSENGDKGEPEMRIPSTYVPLLFEPPLIIGYAWAVDKGANIGVCATLLCFIGLAGSWSYASLLTYVVDANPGRASSAIAFNSACRGISAFIASQIASPLLNSMGHGWFYTGFALVLSVAELCPIAVYYKGKRWREGRSQRGRKITDARAEVPSKTVGEATKDTKLTS